MTKSIGQMAREPITTKIFKILQGIGDRLLGSARVPNIGEASVSARDAWLSAQRPGIMTGCRLPVEPAGRDLTDSANIGVTDSLAGQQRSGDGVALPAPGRQALHYCGFRTGLRPVPMDETDARSLGVIWTYPSLRAGAASRSPWIASSQGLLAMTEKGCF
jgi:hypothetical protein